MIDKDILIELIRIAPSLLVLLFFLLTLLFYHRPIGQLLDRIGSIKAFGVEAEFAAAREQLIGAAKSYQLTLNELGGEDKVKQVIERADRIRDMLRGVRVLWVDDQYLANANIFRFLNAYGIIVDSARDTQEALTTLRWAAAAYEVVVTDIVRGSDHQAGLTLIRLIREEGIQTPILVFVLQPDPTKPIPIGARAITNNPLVLIHHILDVVESGGVAQDAAQNAAQNAAQERKPA
ncbi:MAG: response regulator [Chloroflexi bacterium]|nr:response regulator [Chloroflexota bacterium]